MAKLNPGCADIYTSSANARIFYHHRFEFLAEVAHWRQCLVFDTTAHVPQTFLPQSWQPNTLLSNGPSMSISTSMSPASLCNQVSQSWQRGVFASVGG